MKTGRPRLDPFDIHGNIRTYQRGCRCASCKEASRVASKQHRDKVRAQKQLAALDAMKTPLQKLKESWTQ